MLAGIDVSFWQGTIDWQAARQANYRFAYAKVTEGGSYFDPTFYRNATAARDADVLVGGYHFFRIQQPAKQQAEFFLNKYCSVETDLPPALDFEENTTLAKPQAAAAIKTWLDIVESATGRKPVIYTSAHFWNAAVGAVAWAADYRLWVANYTTGTAPLLPQGWTSWTFWQYTNQGSVPGIGGYVDLNRTMFSETELYQFAGRTGTFDPDPVALEERVTALESKIRRLRDVLKTL